MVERELGLRPAQSGLVRERVERRVLRPQLDRDLFARVKAATSAQLPANGSSTRPNLSSIVARATAAAPIADGYHRVAAPAVLFKEVAVVRHRRNTSPLASNVGEAIPAIIADRRRRVSPCFQPPCRPYSRNLMSDQSRR